MKRIVLSIMCCVFVVGVQSGCAARGYKRIALTAPDTGERVAACYVRGRESGQILGVDIKRIDGRWLLAGRMRGSPPLPPSNITLRVEAVAGDESVVFSDTGTALPTGPGVRHKKRRNATFRFEIPEPGSFDHLHLALISPGEQDLKLPAHGPGR